MNRPLNADGAPDGTSVAFLGIGQMGEQQAIRLLRAGYRLTAWNRTIAKAQALEVHGARIAEAAAQAVQEADFVITMLENGQVVGDVLFNQGVAEALRPHATVIDMSSIRPDQARDHAQQLASLGIAHLDAPVSGGTHGAAQGTLAIMCGGDADVFGRARVTCSQAWDSQRA